MPRLTLADMERHDPQAPPARGDERRFCCPLPECAEKPIDATHRSLCLNVATGEFICNRCHGKGKLDDGKPFERREAWRQSFRIPAPPAPTQPVDLAWRKELAGLVPIEGTRGEAYLSGRGIPADLAHRAGVRFSPHFYGRPAVVFPVRDRAGTLVAADGRYIDDGQPKSRGAGSKSAGVFATPGAWDAGTLLLCEGPMDALSLHAAGHPAIALMGACLSNVVAWGCAFRQVAVATDADEAGDRAAREIAAALEVRGAKALRLRPPNGKDWNDELRGMGAEALGRELGQALEGPPDAASPAMRLASEAGNGFGRPAEETAQDFDPVASTPATEWTPEDQAAEDQAWRDAGAVLPDGEFIAWLRDNWGAVLMLDGKGELRAVGAEKVPAGVREDVRGRQAMLTAHLKRKG